MEINKEWHKKHRMPKNAAPRQRAEWHINHAKECACRPIPASVLRYIKQEKMHGNRRSAI